MTTKFEEALSLYAMAMGTVGYSTATSTKQTDACRAAVVGLYDAVVAECAALQGEVADLRGAANGLRAEAARVRAERDDACREAGELQNKIGHMQSEVGDLLADKDAAFALLEQVLSLISDPDLRAGLKTAPLATLLARHVDGLEASIRALLGQPKTLQDVLDAHADPDDHGAQLGTLMAFAQTKLDPVEFEAFLKAKG